MKNLHLARFAFLVAALEVGAIAQAQYTATLYPSSPYDYTMANGIASGQVVGLAWSQNNPAYYSGILWNAGTQGFTEIFYPGMNYAYLQATDGVSQVGTAGNYDPLTNTNTPNQACVWTGTSASGVLLTGPDVYAGIAFGVDGNRQVGLVIYNSDPNNTRPAAWSGSTATFQDLMPPDAYSGFALSVKGDQAVGTVSPNGGGYYAALWDLAAGTCTNLGQSTWNWSYGYATDGLQQAGAASFDGPFGAGPFATVWSGTAASAVDLNPTGATSSFVYGVSNGKQVGFYVLPDGQTHAVAWSGTSASAVDLHQFLPTDYQAMSFATGVDSNGTICGWAYDGLGQPVSVTWAPLQVSYSFGVGFQQPLNDPASPASVAKKGSTIPIKFNLTTAEGAPASGLKVTIALFKVGTTDLTVNESEFVGPADSGSLFREQGNGSYIYNLSTANLSAGCSYRVTAVLPNGQYHSVIFGVR